MKIAIVIVALCTGLSYTAQSQDFFIHELLDRYFPQNPMNTSFSVFFNHLKSDTTLRNKITLRRTDTSLFSFSGYFVNYKGEFRSPKVDINLGEVVMTDTLKAVDTFFQYQVTYYFKDPLKAKDEFVNFDRHYGIVFSNRQDATITTDNAESGSVRHYFSSLSPVSPITIAWSILDKQQAVFSIMVRMKLEQNALVIYRPWLNPKDKNTGPAIFYRY